ncbi:MAG: hypothetical protein HUU16_15060 [Candidatus Omnitrophica bacterium]|nr:hypothetical protein [bacterium]NUN97480.1 hypothetical protein [Candidatus Omnitrophota bacterium]
MDTKDLNQLAALLTGGLPEADKKTLIKQLLGDSEASHLLTLLLSPDIRVENNCPLPFSTSAQSILGCCEDLLLPIAMDQLQYNGSSRGLASRVAALLPVGPFPLVASRLDFEPASTNRVGPLKFTLKGSPAEGACHLEVSALDRRDRVLEFWEGGVVVLRAPLKAILNVFPFRITPGLAVAVREVDAPEGARFLIVETEFTHTEWKAALVSACLVGDLKRALQILRSRLGWDEGAVSWLARIEVQIAALTALTKTDQYVLRPAPVTRGADSNPSRVEAVHRLIWHGIIRCWPKAEELPSPWSMKPSATSASGQPATSLDTESRALAECCIRSAQGESLSAESYPFDSSSPPIRNGWAALLGWRALLDREFEKAHQAFAATPPLEEDPFSLEMGMVLARHLGSGEETGCGEQEASSDQVWGKILSTVS